TDGDLWSVIVRRRWAIIVRRRGAIIFRRRTVIALRRRIGLGGTTQHANATPDSGTGSRASATANNTADDGAYCRALDAALHHLRRCGRARAGTGVKQR